MRGTILPLPNTPPRRGAQLAKSTRINLPSTFNFNVASDSQIYEVRERRDEHCAVKSMP